MPTLYKFYNWTHVCWCNKLNFHIIDFYLFITIIQMLILCKQKIVRHNLYNNNENIRKTAIHAYLDKIIYNIPLQKKKYAILYILWYNRTIIKVNIRAKMVYIYNL